jgi:hypothetical protein
LALEEFGVVEGGFVPNEDVGSSRDDEVYEKAEDPNSIARSMVSFRDIRAHSLPLKQRFKGGEGKGGRGIERIPCDEEKACELAIDVIPRPGAKVGIFGRLQMNQLCGGLIDKGLRGAKEGQCAVGDIDKGREADGGG